MNPATVSLNNVSIAYDRVPVVQQVSGTFEPGSMTAITGPNGAGKSTLLKSLIGELAPSEGNIERTALPATQLGYLPQAAEIDRHFPITVADLVLLGAWRTMGAFGGATRAALRNARDALSAVGLSGFERRSINALSAGQFQRVLFARLLLQDAPFIVLDEPFTAIDARTERDLMALILRWHGEGRTIIAVLHDFDQVRAHFPNTLLLARELVDWGPTDRVLSPSNLLRARAMSEAWDPTNDTGNLRTGTTG